MIIRVQTILNIDMSFDFEEVDTVLEDLHCIKNAMNDIHAKELASATTGEAFSENDVVAALRVLHALRDSGDLWQKI